jgi:hypothetical protein
MLASLMTLYRLMQRDASLVILAQNRALSQNLFRYKRRISELESTVADGTLREQTLAAVLSILRLSLARLEDDLCARAYSTSPRGAPENPDSLVKPLLERTADADGLLASVLGGGEVAASLEQSLAHVRVAFDQRSEAATHLTAALSAASGSSDCRAGVKASEAVSLGSSRERALHEQLLFAQDALSASRRELADLHARYLRLDRVAHRSERTLERLRYDHPSLDIDAHASNSAPHGLEPAMLVASPTLVDPSLASSSGVGSADLPSAALTALSGTANVVLLSETPAASTEQLSRAAALPNAPPALVPANLSVFSGRVDCVAGNAAQAAADTPVAAVATATAVAAAVAPLEEELVALRDELDAIRALASDRSRELLERDTELAGLTAELSQRRLLRATDADVIVSPLYIHKCEELAVARDRVVDASARMEVAHSHVNLLMQAAAADARRAAEVIRTNSDVSAQPPGYTAALASLQSSLQQALSERDALAARCADLSAAALTSSQWRARCDELTSLVTSMEREQEKLRSDWTAVVAARVASTAARARDGDASESVLAAEVASLCAEKAEIMSMFDSVSVGFEAANSQAARALASAHAAEAEVTRLHAAAGRSATDRMSWSTAKTALERQLVDAHALADAANGVVLSQERVIEALRDSNAALEARVRELQHECSMLSAKAERQPAPESSQELRTQLVLLVQRTEESMTQTGAATSRAIEISAELRRAQEELAMLQRRLAKRDAKISRLHEALAATSSGSTTSAPPPPLALLARSSSTYSVGGPEDATAASDDAHVSRMKEQQLGMLQAMLECSVCRQNHKNAVITKCFHLFVSACFGVWVRSAKPLPPSVQVLAFCSN